MPMVAMGSAARHSGGSAHPATFTFGDLPAAMTSDMGGFQIMVRGEFLLATRVLVGARGPNLHVREIKNERWRKVGR